MNKLKFKIIIPGVIILFLSSCANKVLFQTSTVVPTASGELSIKEVDDDNYLIEADIQYLTEPTNIDDGKPFYVMWVKDRDEVENVGILHLNDDMDATILAQTELDPERVMITVERNPETSEMGDLVVLKSPEMDY